MRRHILSNGAQPSISIRSMFPFCSIVPDRIGRGGLAAAPSPFPGLRRGMVPGSLRMFLLNLQGRLQNAAAGMTRVLQRGCDERSGRILLQFASFQESHRSTAMRSISSGGALECLAAIPIFSSPRTAKGGCGMPQTNRPPLPAPCNDGRYFVSYPVLSGPQGWRGRKDSGP